MNELMNVITLNAYLTDHREMGSPTGLPEWLTCDQAVEYLTYDPMFALVIVGIEEKSFDTEPQGASWITDKKVAVWRGASEELDNFFIGELPLEDPNDAEGGWWTAADALAAAINLMA